MLEYVFKKKDGSYVTNFILAADSYKIGQCCQYPGDTAKIFSNMVPRKAWTSPEGVVIDEVCVVGPQIVAQILSNVIITDAMIDEAEIEIVEQGYDFPRKNWEYIRDLGYIPLQIRALKEGTVVPIGVPIMTIENTDDKCFWLTSYIESWAQDIVWEGTTVASKMRILRKNVNLFCDITGVENKDVVAEYMIHNFGYRGAGDGGQGGIIPSIAHALFFSGSDGTSTNRYIKKIFNTSKPYLSSVDASEHSTMCANSDQFQNDFAAFEMGMGMLERAVKRAEKGIGIPVVANVIDTYDDERFIKEFVIKNYNRICEIGGKYVCRPDSGNAITKPIEVVKWLMHGLADRDESLIAINDDGYISLPPNIGVIQGDGLRFDDFIKIIRLAVENKISASNLCFGFGGGLTNGSGRDDFSFSMKATARMTKDDVWVPMQKSPKSDPKKKSLAGLVSTFMDSNGNYFAGPEETSVVDESVTDQLITIYSHGIPSRVNFDQARSYARRGL